MANFTEHDVIYSEEYDSIVQQVLDYTVETIDEADRTQSPVFWVRDAVQKYAEELLEDNEMPIEWADNVIHQINAILMEL